jgi:hypothetical protein
MYHNVILIDNLLCSGEFLIWSGSDFNTFKIKILLYPGACNKCVYHFVEYDD